MEIFVFLYKRYNTTISSEQLIITKDIKKLPKQRGLLQNKLFKLVVISAIQQ